MMLTNLTNLDDLQISNINELTLNLSSMEKNMLYNSNKKSATLPFVINFIAGFGIGSYIEGDITGGNIALIGDLSSLTLILLGYTQALSSAYNNNYTGTEGSALLFLGSVGYLSTRIYELIRPFTYASSYNKKLSSVLMNIAIVPQLTETNNLNMALSYKIRL